MNIVNLVGKLSFDTDLKGAEKFLKIAKDCNEQAKELKKNLKKAGEDDAYLKLSEQAKTMRENLKNVKESLFRSERTEKLSQQLDEVREQKRIENIAFRTRKRSISQHARWKDETKKKKIKELKSLHEANVISYDTEILQLQKDLKASKAEDKKAFMSAYSAGESSVKTADKAVATRKKQLINENKLTKEKIENLKDEEAQNKDYAKEKNRAQKNGLMALGKFSLALGIAVGALKGIQAVYEKLVDINATYAGAGAGGNMTSQELQSFATFLRGFGVTTGKTELTTKLGQINSRANLRSSGGNMRADLGMAGINPQEATNVIDFLQQAYASYLRGEDSARLKDSIAKEGYNANEAFNLFASLKAKGYTPERFKNEARASRPAVSQEQNIKNLALAGRFNRAIDTATGKFGEDFQKNAPPITLLYDFLSNYAKGFIGSQGGNISINKNVTINTNNPDVAKEVVGDDKPYKILQMNTGGN